MEHRPKAFFEKWARAHVKQFEWYASDAKREKRIKELTEYWWKQHLNGMTFPSLPPGPDSDVSQLPHLSPQKSPKARQRCCRK